MKDDIKKYNTYNSVDPDIIEKEDLDISSYPQDAYVRPADAKPVGKLDGYNKEKVNYQHQKAKVILKESNISSQEKKLDDLIPDDIGNAIDSVFSKVDNLLNATGKLFFGSGKTNKSVKTKLPRPPQFDNPDSRYKEQKIQGNSAVINPVVTYGQTPQAKAPVQNPQAFKDSPAPVNKPQVTQAPAYKSSIVKAPPKASAKNVSEEVDNTPLVTRTTVISDLDIPMDLLNDPDLVRYFDQMKLYDKKVDGGLCSLTQKQASEIIRKGRWGKLFMISYDQLKINTIMSTADAGTSRFTGMSPVYKAQGRKFTNTEELRKAIEKDVNLYIKNGQGSGEFHKFTYRRK